MTRTTQIFILVTFACFVHSMSAVPVRSYGNSFDLKEFKDILEKIDSQQHDGEGKKWKMWKNVLSCLGPRSTVILSLVMGYRIVIFVLLI